MKTCKWTLDGEIYETECGYAQEFICDGIKENHYLYCPFCGRVIYEKVEAEGGP